MKILHDYFIVTIDQQYETSALPSGIIPVSGAWVDPEDENSNKHKRVYGKVITCPETFSDTVCSLVDPGLPPPEPFVGHDMIQARVNQGYGFESLPKYYPSTFDKFGQITFADIAKKVNVKINDRIYFDHNAINPDNLLGMHQGKEMYKIRVDQIYCSVVRILENVDWVSWIDVIQMQGGWALVQPDMETWEDITTPSGIITKAQPGARFEQQFDETGTPLGYEMVVEGRYLTGFVRHIAPRYDLKAGDKIMYMHNSDAPLKVEGRDYYVMMEDDIIVKL